MNGSRLTFAALALAMAVSGRAAGPLSNPDAVRVPESTTYTDLEFAHPGDVSLKLDLYLPSGSGPYPVIVSIHGGSWTSGDRSQGTAVFQVSRGYAVANIDYRLAPTFTWPTQIEDCKAAVRWLRAHAPTYDLDPNAIGVMGYSAGGHLAAVLGTSAGVDALEGADLGNADQSSRVEAVVDYFGPTDLLKLREEVTSCEPYSVDDPNAPPYLLMGCTDLSCADKFETANPIRYVTADDPPFLILHGTSDCLVPWQQSQILYDALQDAHIQSKLVLVPFAGHADPVFLLPAIQDQVNNFLDAHLKPAPAHRMRAIRRQ